jgi:tripartite-type tricarboxylate transporter receptor subunit TctC
MLRITYGRILLGAALALSLAVQAQDYPSRPIKLVVSVPPGGSVDLIARLVAEKLRQKWGQPIVVENRAGASNNIGAEAVFKAPPDGYTLLFSPQTPLVINKSLYRKLSYDPEALTPVSMLATNPLVLIVHPKVPADSFQQLLAYAKANPDRLNYASGGTGTSPHLTGELFQSLSAVRIVHIPYKGVSLAVTGVLGGQVDMMFVDISTALPHIRSGAVRVLAVASDKRNSALPNIPASPEVLPGLLAETWFGMTAPPNTPAAIVHKLSAAVAEVLRQPEVVKQLLDMGNIEVIGSTPEEMAAFMRQDIARWGKVIRDTGATAE